VAALANANIDLGRIEGGSSGSWAKQAKRWIGELLALARTSELPYPELFKANILSARWHLISIPGELSMAKSALREAEKAAAQAKALGIAVTDQGDDTASLKIVEGLIQLAERDNLNAIECFEEVLLSLSSDPVLEAETRLHLALALVRAGRVGDTRLHLEWWEDNKGAIDYSYLRQLQKQAHQALLSVIKNIPVSIPIDADIEHAVALTRYAVIKRHRDLGRSVIDIAKLLNVNRTTVHAWINAVEPPAG